MEFVIRKTNNHQAFTLIELIIAVVIIAVASSMAAVTYGNYSKRAKNQEATQLLIAVWDAQKAYKRRNGVYTNFTQANMSADPAFNIDITSAPKYFKDLTSQNAVVTACGDTSLAVITERNDEYQLYITDDARIVCYDLTDAICGGICQKMGF